MASEASTQAAPTEGQTQPRTNYQSTPPLLQIVDYLLSSPSIPEQMRRQFHALWEMPVLGNFYDIDILRLRLEFDEWCILLLMSIPDCQWGNTVVYEDKTGSSVNFEKLESGEIVEKVEGGFELRMDMNQLLNMLKSAYYIQLTRGREGFTTKELTTTRNRSIFSDENQHKQKMEFKLF